MALPRATVGAPIGAAEYNEMVDQVDALWLPAFWADSAGSQSIASANSGDGTTVTNYTTATSREWVGTVLTSGTATIPINGWYRVSGSAVMASAGTDPRFIRIMVGTTFVFGEQMTAGGIYLSATSVIRLNAGDQIKMTLRQFSGAAVNANSFQFSVVCEQVL